MMLGNGKRGRKLRERRRNSRKWDPKWRRPDRFNTRKLAKWHKDFFRDFIPLGSGEELGKSRGSTKMYSFYKNINVKNLTRILYKSHFCVGQRLAMRVYITMPSCWTPSTQNVGGKKKWLAKFTFSLPKNARAKTCFKGWNHSALDALFSFSLPVLNFFNVLCNFVSGSSVFFLGVKLLQKSLSKLLQVLNSTLLMGLNIILYWLKIK